MLCIETEREKELAQQLRDFKLCSAPLWEQDMKNRDSKNCSRPTVFFLLLSKAVIIGDTVSTLFLLHLQSNKCY